MVCFARADLITVGWVFDGTPYVSRSDGQHPGLLADRLRAPVKSIPPPTRPFPHPAAPRETMPAFGDGGKRADPGKVQDRSTGERKSQRSALLRWWRSTYFPTQ